MTSWLRAARPRRALLLAGLAFVLPASGKCLGDPAFNTTNGTQLVLWTCNGGTNQHWTLP